MDPRRDERLPVVGFGDDISLEDIAAFADNPEPRCACVLLLDTSPSMSGSPIRALNAGVKAFNDAIEDDPVASLRVETSIVSFSGKAKLVQDFATVDALAPVSLGIDWLGGTNIATGINFALDMVEERKRVYKDAGISYYQPWVVMITDGESTESKEQMMVASERVRHSEESKQLAFFCVGVERADMEELKRIAPHRTAPLKGLAFREFFVWLSKSMTAVSSSRVDDEIDLSANDMSGWLKL